MTTYNREKPCIKCGGHEFIINGNRCFNCRQIWLLANAEHIKTLQRNWRIRYPDKFKAAQDRWCANNREYISLYNKARYQRLKERTA